MKLTRMIFFLKTRLLAAMTALILILPAYGQQDVNPTWYNPWPDAPKAAAQPTQTKITAHRAAKRTHKNHSSLTQVRKKQAPVPEPLRTAEALPPVRK